MFFPSCHSSLLLHLVALLAVCCIYHKPKAFGDSSSDSDSGSESDSAKPGGVPTRRAAEKAKAARAPRRRGAGEASDSSESDSSVERRRIRQRRHERDAARMQGEHQAALEAGVVLSAALPPALVMLPRGAQPAASATSGAVGPSAAEEAGEGAASAATAADAAGPMPDVSRSLETSTAQREAAAAHDTADEDGID